MSGEAGDSGSTVRNLFHKCFPVGFKDELKVLLKIALPISGSMVTQMGMTTVSFAFCGHLEKVILDSVALAISMTNVFGQAVLYGLGTACDTLFSQTYGSSNRSHLGVVLQRSIIILLLCCFPCGALFYNTGNVFRVVGQEAIISENGGKFAKLFIAALPAMAIYTPLTKYLQAQSLVLPSMFIGIIINILNGGMHWLFLFKLDLGIWGAGAALVSCNWLMVILHLIYIRLWKVYRDTWTGFSLECLDDWGPFFSLAIPGMFMICVEWWSYEILTFLTGLLGQTPLAAYTLTTNIEMLVFMLPLGLSIGASVRVGNHLGAGNHYEARKSSRVAIIMTILIVVIITALMFGLKDFLPLVFTSDSDVAALTTKLVMLLCLVFLFDGSQGVFSGVIRGSGNQLFGALTNIFSYYVIALPIGIPLMFKTRVGVNGAMIGLAVCTFSQAVIFAVKILRTDWKAEAEKALNRVGETGSSNSRGENKETDTMGSINNEAIASSNSFNALCEVENDTVGETEPEDSNIQTKEISANSPTDSKKNDQKLKRSNPRAKTYILRLLFLFCMVSILCAGILLDIKLSELSQTGHNNCSIVANSTVSNTTFVF